MDYKMMMTERADEIAYDEYEVDSFYDRIDLTYEGIKWGDGQGAI